MSAAGNGEDEPVIALDDVRVSYGAEPVLDDFSFAVRGGETVVVFGESGSGKSTVLMLILGLLHPDAGRVEVVGQQISGQKESALYPIRRRIGMVFQHGALFDSETVERNIGFRMLQTPDPDYQAYRREVAEKLAFVGLSDYGDRFPGELSGGQRKRVAIARAMVGNPEIMLYDEPTTGLDPITARKVLDVMRRVKTELGTTSVVVTHELHYAYTIADRVVLIRDGWVVFDGTPEMFRASDDPFIREFRSMGSE